MHTADKISTHGQQTNEFGKAIKCVEECNRGPVIRMKCKMHRAFPVIFVIETIDRP